MTYSRNWDESFPPDTQAANLLGQDIRDFKEDIRERTSSLCGIEADKPAVLDMITGWGAYGGNGFMFFATDTGKIWKWTGAAWLDVTTNFVPVATVLATEETLYNASDPSYAGVSTEITELVVSITTSGGDVLVTCAIPAFMDGAGEISDFYLGIDGVSTGQILAKYSQSPVFTFPNIFMEFLFTGVGAGAHTFSPFVQTTGADDVHLPMNTVVPGVITAQERDF